jgi:hypothetical protein
MNSTHFVNESCVHYFCPWISIEEATWNLKLGCENQQSEETACYATGSVFALMLWVRSLQQLAQGHTKHGSWWFVHYFWYQIVDHMFSLWNHVTFWGQGIRARNMCIAARKNYYLLGYNSDTKGVTVAYRQTEALHTVPGCCSGQMTWFLCKVFTVIACSKQVINQNDR